MFPTRYFPGRMFAGRFWPKAAAVAPTLNLPPITVEEGERPWTVAETTSRWTVDEGERPWTVAEGR